MLNENKKTIYAFLAGVILGSCLLFFVPKETVSEKRTEEKVALNEDSQVQRNTVTKINQVQHPDGTIVTNTEISNQDHESKKTDLTREVKTEEITIVKSKPLNRIQAKAILPIETNPIPYYELTYSRAVWGVLRLEGAINTRKEARVGALIEIEF